MHVKTPEGLLNYNRTEGHFIINKIRYTIRTTEGIYVIGRAGNRDLFYLNSNMPFMHYPAQISLYTYRCDLLAVAFYKLRLNRAIFETIPERWLEIWTIALFKQLSSFFGEENLISSVVLDGRGHFNIPSYNHLLDHYSRFEKHYPDSMMPNRPYTRNTVELDYIVAIMYEFGHNKYFKSIDAADFHAELVTQELQLAYAEVFSTENVIYLHNYLQGIDGVNDAVMIRKIYVVFQGHIPVLAFCKEYEKLMLEM